MALKELYESYVGENDFWKKVAGACMNAAIEISAEGGGVPNHANRIQWALSVKENVKGIARSKEVLAAVLQDAAIAADVDNATDAAIQSAVDALVDTWAV